MERDRTMAKTRVDADGTNEQIFCDPIEITLRLKIDVTDEPEDLTEGAADFLRRLVSEDPEEQAVAEEDLVWALAMSCDVVSGCMSCDSETADALEICGVIGAVELLADSETIRVATNWRHEQDYKKRKGKTT